MSRRKCCATCSCTDNCNDSPPAEMHLRVSGVVSPSVYCSDCEATYNGDFILACIPRAAFGGICAGSLHNPALAPYVGQTACRWAYSFPAGCHSETFGAGQLILWAVRGTDGTYAIIAAFANLYCTFYFWQIYSEKPSCLNANLSLSGPGDCSDGSWCDYYTSYSCSFLGASIVVNPT